MQRTSYQIQIENSTEFKTQLLLWSQQFKTAVWLDSNNYQQKHSNFDAALAVGAFSKIETNYKNAFKKLKEYQTKINDYIFGYLSYDLKNDVENLTSSNFDGLNFPELFFFQPSKIIFIKGTTITLKYLNQFKHEIEQDINEIKKQIKNTNIEYIQKDEDPRDYKVSFQKIKDELNFKITNKVEDGISQIIKITKSGIINNLNSSKYRNV